MARSGRTATSAGRKRDDQKPLIGSEWRSLDGKEFDDRDGDSGFWTPDTENDDNQDSDTMPFGFGKKKKNAALIEKEVSPPPQQFKEEQNAEIMSVKADEPAYIAEDATANDAGHIAVTQALVEEETMVEVVASEAVDGGTNQMIIETELLMDLTHLMHNLFQKVVGEKEEKGKTIEEMATETIEKDESAKEAVAMTEETEVVDQVASEDKAMELVPVSSNATEDLAVTQEMMSVDMDVLEDDDEVAILDRFEMLGQPAEPIPVETIVDKPVFDTPAPVVEKQQKKQPRVESTPLIRKQPTKVKDTQPGFLCCTII